VFFRIAFPVILILVFGTIFMDQRQRNLRSGGAGSRPDDVVRTARKALELSGRFKITQISPAIDAAQYARDNKRNLVLTIPKGFEESLMQRMGLDDPMHPLPSPGYTTPVPLG
jgi:ABC-2 type transport system permease protein